MLLNYPNLKCEHCYALKRDDNIPPECEVGVCPIEDVATDIDLNLLIHKYLRAKSLYQLTEDPKTQEGVFQELGLYNSPDFHLKIETIYAKYLAKNRSMTVKQGRKWNKILT